MTVERLVQLRQKVDAVAADVRAAKAAFRDENPNSETSRQLTLSCEWLDDVDEQLQDAIRYHPQGDCPR
jgi:hypothetical protein